MRRPYRNDHDGEVVVASVRVDPGTKYSCGFPGAAADARGPTSAGHLPFVSHSGERFDAREPAPERENPAATRVAAVARPGLEPGTPRFSVRRTKPLASAKVLEQRCFSPLRHVGWMFALCGSLPPVRGMERGSSPGCAQGSRRRLGPGSLRRALVRATAELHSAASGFSVATEQVPVAS